MLEGLVLEGHIAAAAIPAGRPAAAAALAEEAAAALAEEAAAAQESVAEKLAAGPTPTGNFDLAGPCTGMSGWPRSTSPSPCQAGPVPD